VDAGDSIVSRREFGAADATVWTASSAVSADGVTTVTLTDADSIFVVTFVVATNSYTIGTLDIPRNAARFFIEIAWPWMSRTAKIAIDFKLVVPSATTVTATGSNDLTFTRNSVDIGRFFGDAVVRVAEADFDVVFGARVDTSAADVDLKTVATDSVYTIAATFNIVGAPYRIMYDPIIEGGSEDPSLSPYSTGSVNPTGSTTGSQATTGTSGGSQASASESATSATGSSSTSTGTSTTPAANAASSAAVATPVAIILSALALAAL